MTTSRNYLAIDLGAESGRMILGQLDENLLQLKETHRFPNVPVRLPDGLHWDVLRLWKEIKAGISATVQRNHHLASLGLDTWGVDFALLDKNGGLLGNPYHYRDSRTDGMLEEAYCVMPRNEIFANTGIQFMQLNSLYQLLAMVREKSPLLDIAETFLTIPDLFNYWLSGEITNEFTNATTTQCLDPSSRDWAYPLLDALNIPTQMFGTINHPGTILGALIPEVASETGAVDVQVVIPSCHDTGSAVVAVPAQDQDFAWLSSGTWSIIGAEVNEPVVNEKALDYNFTNEGGVFDTWRLSKNIMGLWLVQECHRAWQAEGKVFSYDDLTRMAEDSLASLAVIDPDDAVFFHPGSMPDKIRSYCRDTGQRTPNSAGEVIRVALESLALKYRWVLERLEELGGKKLSPLHIIGGGTKNRLLNQFTADAINRTVVAGPVEATAIGNILMQAIALGDLGSLTEARKVVRDSFQVEEFHPKNPSAWDASYTKLLSFLEKE